MHPLTLIPYKYIAIPIQAMYHTRQERKQVRQAIEKKTDSW